MPGVTVLPMSPALGPGFGSPPPSATLNGFPRSRSVMSVAEIKGKAKEDARKHSRGASALTLIGTARKQSVVGRECELEGDLKGALSAFTKAASLAQICMTSAEFSAESQPGKKGALYKEVFDFQKHEGSDLAKRVEVVETKLKELERPTAPSNGTDGDDAGDGPVLKPGGSIADRMRSLQDAGMTVNTTKRFSRELPNPPPTPPMSPSHHRLSSPPAQLSTLSTPLMPSSSVAPSPHALVPTSSLGPPSPTSSTSSSPRLSHFTLSEFSQTFPSIDELDEVEGLKLPSVPTGASTSSTGSNGPGRRAHTKVESTSYRPFPVLPVDPGPRPSSTPLTPTINTFVSRPGSPVKSPISPAIAHKPSALGLSSIAASSSSAPERDRDSKLPVTNVVSPRVLKEMMHQVLLLDVRTREEFKKEHIKSDAIVCLEPSVLQRENVNASTIEDSLSIAPPTETLLFSNRDKFDRVAIYDASSTTFGPPNSPLSALVRAIYETAFKKILKNTPMLLVGGLEEWKKEMGEEGIVHGLEDGTEAAVMYEPEPQKPRPPVSGAGPAVMSPTVVSVPESSRYWTPPRAQADMEDKGLSHRSEDRTRHNFDYPGSPRSSITSNDVNGYQSPGDSARQTPARRPAVSASPSTYSRNVSENVNGSIPQSVVNGTSSIQYPQFPRRISPTSSGSSSFSTGTPYGVVSPPPQASIHSLSRRRSDFVDQSQEALSGLTTRPSIDYPDLSSKHILRPPPVAASSALERQDNRPRLAQHSHSLSTPPTPTQAGPRPPTIQSDYPVTYWSDMQIATSGLKNLGNTCYMNATIQCLSATVPFARFFTDGRWKSAINMVNPLGTKGNLANAFASILHQMWHSELPYLSPLQFRRSLCMHASQFSGSDQHDSQEFLSFLLDGLHEDLNRILHKPAWESTPEREAELERLPQQIASEQEWKIYRMRNDSLIVDFFQGQFRNRLECLTCHKTSTTYNTFMYLTLPVPTGRGSTKVSLQQCLDAFVKEEVMEKTDAWHCPNCKTLRRATKLLSLSRLPPILLIHLKRFSFKGPFTDKIETFVDFPLRALDLTNYMPPPLPPGVSKQQLNGGRPMSADDPRSQAPPYKYDLYGVTNHFGSLSSGHYTAFISSRGGWLYCDDSRVQPADAKEVVGRPAYVLFYKRTKA